MLLKRFGPNLNGRDFVVGDIHGQLSALSAAMAGVSFNKAVDRLFMLGDLVDRGADSFDCLKLVYEAWANSILGNHEVMMRAALMPGAKDSDLLHWIKSGGNWFFNEDTRELTQVGLDAISRMPYAIELEVDGKLLGLVHAEPPVEGWEFLRTLESWADDELITDVQDQMIWSRKRIRSNDETIVAGVDAVVCGHSIVEAPRRLGNVNYIDTGAYTVNGRLTIMDVRELF